MYDFQLEIPEEDSINVRTRQGLKEYLRRVCQMMIHGHRDEAPMTKEGRALKDGLMQIGIRAVSDTRVYWVLAFNVNPLMV